MATEPEAFDELAVETTRLMAEFVSTVIRNANELETRKTLANELRTQGQVVEHMQTGLWIWSPDENGAYRLDHANAASELATGVIAEAIVGATLEEVLPATTGKLMSIFERVRTTGELVDAGEVEYGDARIEYGCFWVKAFPLPGERIAMTFENVTEMVRARRALQESEGRFRSAFHAASVGMRADRARRQLRPGERPPGPDARLRAGGAVEAQRARRDAPRRHRRRRPVHRGPACGRARLKSAREALRAQGRIS